MKRWGKTFSEDIKVLFPLGYAHAKEIPYKYAMHKVQHLCDDLVGCTEWMKKSNYDPEICKKATEEFYTEGWDSPNLSHPNGLYKADPPISSIFLILTELTEKGYDVRKQWRQFRDVITKIWVTLPDFLKGDTWYKVRQPSDYDPTNPYPELEIPQDIDE